MSAVRGVRDMTPAERAAHEVAKQRRALVRRIGKVERQCFALGHSPAAVAQAEAIERHGKTLLARFDEAHS